AAADGLLRLGSHMIGETAARHGADNGVGIERIAQGPAAGIVDEALDEVAIDRFMHIDALDAAAGLAGIEEATVSQVLDGVGEIGVGTDIGGVLAAQFEPERGESAGRRLLDATTAFDR